MTDRFTRRGFADYVIEQRGHTNTFLDAINKFVNWNAVEKKLSTKFKKTAGADGRPAYPALPMFKLMLLRG